MTTDVNFIGIALIRVIRTGEAVTTSFSQTVGNEIERSDFIKIGSDWFELLSEEVCDRRVHCLVVYSNRK